MIHTDGTDDEQAEERREYERRLARTLFQPESPGDFEALLTTNTTD